MKTRSIQHQLAIIFIVIALVPLAIMAFINHQQVQNSRTLNDSAKLNQLSSIAKQLAETWFVERLNNSQQLAELLTRDSAQNNALTSPLIDDYIKLHPYINAIELIEKPKQFTSLNTNYFSAINRDDINAIFTRLNSSQKAVFRSFAVDKQTFHIIATPLFNSNEQLHAVLLIDISVAKLLRYLKLQVMQNTQADFYIFYKNNAQGVDSDLNQLLTLPFEPSLMALPMFEYTDKNKQLHAATTTKLNFLNAQSWQLVVTKPVVFSKFQPFLTMHVIPVLVVIILIMSALGWSHRRLSRPLHQLTHVTDENTTPALLNSNAEFAHLPHELQLLINVQQQQHRQYHTQATSLQNALKQLAQQKSALDEHAIVAVTDLKGTITFANSKFCKISGYEHHELVGENHRILNSGVHPKAFFKNMYKALKKDKIWHGQICNKAKDGRFYWVDTTIAVFVDNDGRAHSYVAIRTDITALKLQEIELEQHKTQLELVIDSTAVGIWDWYIDTGKVTFNSRWSEIIGYTLSELTPTSIETWQKYAHPEDLVLSNQKLQEHFAGKTEHYVCEARMRHKQGHWIWVLDTAKVVEYNSDGSPKRMIGTHLDISEQKATQEQLQSSRDQFATLVGNIPGIIYRCKYDALWTMIYMSKQTSEITGYEPTALINNQQHSFISIIHPDDRTDVKNKIRECVQEHRSWSIEYRIITNDNSIRWVNDKGQAIYDTNEDVPYLDGFILDITERHEAQLKIARQQDLLESMSKQGQIGAWEINLNTNAVYWSDEVKAIHDVPSDYEPEITTAINFYKSGEHRQIIETLFEKAITTGQSWSVELIILTHKGNEIWVKSMGQAEFKEGECVRVFGSFQNIDAHKRLELESEKANRYNKNLATLTVSPEVQSSDVDKVKLLAVKSMCEVLDVDRASVWIFNEQRDAMLCHSLYIKGEGHVHSNSELSVEQYPAYYDAIYKQNLIAIDDVYTHAATSDFIDSYAIPLNVKSMLDAVIATGDGNLGILCVETVGEPRHWTQGEETYLRSLATLVGSSLVSQRRKQTAEKLKVALVQAKEAGVAKSQFLATMSHEIRTPMNGVLGMLELIQLEPLPKHVETKVGIAKQSAHSLLAVINDILDFSKVEAGKVELESINFNARDLIGYVAEAQALSAQGKGIEIILDLVAVEPSHLKGDPSRIRQVLTNLLSNAVKFTSQGEVVISASIKPTDQGLEFKVSVKDSGIGISKEKQKQLFSPFTQVDASTTREYGGTGLGLAICKQLCELMGGYISVSSEIGKGSVFTAQMILEEGEEQERYVPNVNINELTILVVDDNQTNRLVISEQLGHWGAHVELASDAKQALEMCENRIKNQQKVYDIAVLDMQMPDMDGIELCKILKADANYQPMPLVMMTSIAGMEDAQRYSDAGFQAYFPKPVTTADLISALSVIANNPQKQALPLVTPGFIASMRKDEADKPAEILLVEDNPINQQVSTLMLKKLSCEVTVAENGQQAIEILSAHEKGHFSLVLMDCQMPVMDGYSATTAIRNNAAGEQHKAIKIIALTANAMESDKQRCIDAGMDDYLSKPIQLDVLKQKLEQYF